MEYLVLADAADAESPVGNSFAFSRGDVSQPADFPISSQSSITVNAHPLHGGNSPLYVY